MKAVAIAAALGAGSAYAVASCLGRDAAHRSGDEISFVETTSATRESIRDTSGGPAAPAGRVAAPNRPAPPSSEPTATTTITAGEVAGTVEQPTSGHAAHSTYDPTQLRSLVPPSTPVRAGPAGNAPSQAAPGDTTGAAASSVRDAGARGAATSAPTQEPGPGRFATDAPPGRASAFVSNPEAGAGPFVTDRPMPDYR